MINKCLICFAIILSGFIQARGACNTGQSSVVITIVPDNYPNETSWSLRDGITNALLDTGRINSDSICVLSSQCLKFTIFDRFGDGICCSLGHGSYTVTIDGAVIASGGDFNYSQTTYFNCPAGYDCGNPLAAVEDTMTAPLPDTWYMFTADSTGMYEISACELDNSCNTKIYIYDHCAGLLFDENNTGTTFYDDDGCSSTLQSKISTRLTAGSTFYIRIGDSNGSCSGQIINWQIKFMGAIQGCTDPVSCNYNPLATVSDSSCMYYPDSLCAYPDLTVNGNALETSMRMDVVTANQSNCYISEGCLSGYGVRRVIRFATHVRNIGNQDYYIGTPDTVSNQFVLDACHGHWHYKGYAEYLVFDKDHHPLQQGFKNGFCVMDLECSGGGSPKFSCSNMGLSSGCGDVYSASLDCQWIDVTDLDTGNYTLVVRVNWDRSPDKLGHVEKTFENNWAQVCFHLYYDAGHYKVFDILPDCGPYVDCVGDTLGNAIMDCTGVCNGSMVRGDVDLSHDADSADINLYLNGIKDENITCTPCNDLNGDSLVTVTDAVRLNGCLLSDSGLHHHTGNYQNTHKHCEFPFNISNPFDSITFSIADINLINHYIDLSVYNPTCMMLAYEFKLHGLAVDSVKSLIPGNYEPDIRSSATGHVVAISKDETSLSKQLGPLNFMRVYFSSLTDTQICISEIIALVNSNYEEVNGKIDNGCVNIAQPNDTGITQSNWLTPENLKVIPNPSEGVFELYLDNKSLFGATLKVFNQTGTAIYKTSNQGLSNHFALDISGNPSGIYILQMNINGNHLMRRLMLTEK